MEFILMKKTKAVDVKEFDGDGTIKLSALYELIPKLQKKYGKHAELEFDAGYNNVQVIVYPTKKEKIK